MRAAHGGSYPGRVYSLSSYCGSKDEASSMQSACSDLGGLRVSEIYLWYSLAAQWGFGGSGHNVLRNGLRHRVIFGLKCAEEALFR